MEWLILLIAVATVAYWLVARPNRSGPRPAYTDLSHLPPQFVVFDLETTGLDATRDEIIEFGAIRVNRDSDEHQTYQMLVKPSEKLSAKIVQLTGITQEMLNTDGQLIGEALEGFLDFAGTLPLVSFNAEFDMAFLHAAASRHGRTVANPVSCALEMARRAWPRRKSYRLVDLAKDGSLDAADAHRALADAHNAMIVYVAASCVLGRSR